MSNCSVGKKGAPFPSERKSSCAKAVRCGGRLDAKGEVTADKRRDVDGPKTVFEIQFDEVKRRKTRCVEQGRSGRKLKSWWRVPNRVVGADVKEEAILRVGLVCGERGGCWL